mmetsp:Transcript_40577/g.116059  ORF Transcript_40577/g.116059 Transcript_40577/m.116059 type:complete len:295 (-) Transcript_40577:662-1546(-)
MVVLPHLIVLLPVSGGPLHLLLLALPDLALEGSPDAVAQGRCRLLVLLNAQVWSASIAPYSHGLVLAVVVVRVTERVLHIPNGLHLAVAGDVRVPEDVARRPCAAGLLLDLSAAHDATQAAGPRIALLPGDEVAHRDHLQTRPRIGRRAAADALVLGLNHGLPKARHGVDRRILKAPLVQAREEIRDLGLLSIVRVSSACDIPGPDRLDVEGDVRLVPREAIDEVGLVPREQWAHGDVVVDVGGPSVHPQLLAQLHDRQELVQGGQTFLLDHPELVVSGDEEDGSELLLEQPQR